MTTDHIKYQYFKLIGGKHPLYW